MWNRIAVLMVLLAASILFLTPFEVEARGGGRGGGGRGVSGRSAGSDKGGSAYRGGHAMNRTPTMSRATSKPAASQVRQQPKTRPSISQGSVKQSRQAVQQRPAVANRAELRNHVNRYAKNRPVQNVDRQVLVKKAQNFSSKRGSQSVQNRQISEKVSRRLQQVRPDSNHWFDRSFFERHNIDVDYTGARANWWRPAAWAMLAGWGAWNWSTPYYYDDGGYAYPITTTESTYSPTVIQSQDIQTQPTQSIQNTATAGDDWLSLGVFAVANNADAAAYTNHFIQLAINRNGEIAGVLYNSTTDTARELTGMVDPTSQIAYWSMANRADSPIASTGIYNLTEDETPINVHFADGSDQTWSLVRLKPNQ